MRAAARIGYRRVVLALFGVGYAVFGTVLLAGSGHDRFSRPGASPLDPLDSPWWGWMWLAGGVAAMVAAVLDGRRDPLGFAALQIPASVWAAFYVWSVAIYVGTGGEFGESDAWVGATHWGLLVTLLGALAGWPDDDGTRPSKPKATG